MFEAGAGQDHRTAGIAGEIGTGAGLGWGCRTTRTQGGIGIADQHLQPGPASGKVGGERAFTVAAGQAGAGHQGGALPGACCEGRAIGELDGEAGRTQTGGEGAQGSGGIGTRAVTGDQRGQRRHHLQRGVAAVIFSQGIAGRDLGGGAQPAGVGWRHAEFDDRRTTGRHRQVGGA